MQNALCQMINSITFLITKCNKDEYKTKFVSRYFDYIQKYFTSIDYIRYYDEKYSYFYNSYYKILNEFINLLKNNSQYKYYYNIINNLWELSESKQISKPTTQKRDKHNKRNYSTFTNSSQDSWSSTSTSTSSIEPQTKRRRLNENENHNNHNK